MSKRLKLLTLIGISLLILVSALSALAEDATSKSVYLPVMMDEGGSNNPPPTATPQKPYDEELSIAQCRAKDNVGGVQLFEVSTKEYPNGTKISDILRELWMTPGDFGYSNKLNGKYYFPQGEVNVADGASRVCLPRKYHLLFNNDAPASAPSFVEFNDGRPDWGQYLLGGSVQIASTTGISDTWAFVLGAVDTVSNLPGVNLVGSWGAEVAESRAGTFVKIVAGGAFDLLVPAANVIVGTVALKIRLQAVNTEGVSVPAVTFTNDTGMIRSAVDITTAYIRCFPSGAVDEALKISVPDRRRTYFVNGSNGGGCVIRQNPWDSGDKAWPWNVVLFVAERAVTEKKFDKAFIEGLTDEIDDWLKRSDDDPNNDPQPVPIPAGDECPQMGKFTMVEASIVRTIDELAVRWQMASEYDWKTLSDWTTFTNEAANNWGQLVWDDSYAQTRPRANEFIIYDAMVSTHGHPDTEGNEWLVQTACLDSGGRMVWVNDYTVGRLASGLARGPNDKDPDWKKKYPFKWSD